MSKLFLISILHQTATVTNKYYDYESCSLSVFYIKPQLSGGFSEFLPCCSLSIFYIKPQRAFADGDSHQRCSLSIFYIKPQRCYVRDERPESCSLSIFYIKPQPNNYVKILEGSCSLSIFYIKPQRPVHGDGHPPVVPYQYSTSNRNVQTADFRVDAVVPYQYSTSNRNCRVDGTPSIELFLINILHQTATFLRQEEVGRWLFLINILHQTATP